MQKMPLPWLKRAGYWTFLIACLWFVLLCLFSESFAAVRAEHDCPGGECPICPQIQWARNFYRQLRYAAFHPGFPLIVLLISALILKIVPFYFIPITSVSLKIKINE
jgi:hypothetical protein